MQGFKNKYTFYLLLYVLALSSPAFSAPEKCDYQEFQRMPLFEDGHGINGALVVKRDKRFMYERWAGADTPETRCNARLYILDRNNKKIFSQNLEKPIAALETVTLSDLQPKTFALKVDFGVGFGSYAGRVYTFFDVMDGKIRWVMSRHNGSKKTEKLSVMSSLKTGWEIVRAGERFDILEATCRPDFDEKTNEASFSIIYSRFHYNGSEWIEYRTKRKGYWDFEGEFPDYASFPKAK